ncbi:hypothetical protein [Streptomyces sp. CBMA123]|uniref:hypothetical protein n=1 Tax=Streptomyces sp. CBMA123 TaxID=1896313 RepID=UPI001662027B|nr:hypothetical protein [Streptomyces sp. CBMA123]MBD0693569.1 hypothetical protein [Streptomyces sp. CBMA123]
MSGTEDLRVAFHDYRRPLATAGVYTLTAEHRLTKDGARVDTPAIPTATQQFEIRAARFVLDPSSVHAHYPADGASGDFSRTLPHITLDRSILPWERLLKARAVPEQAPWLTLMVFRAGELPDDPEGLGQSTSRTIAELRRPGAGILGPDLSDTGITPGIEASRCRSIDVPAELFTALVPREEELHYLAHVRDVSTRPQRRDDGEILTEGQYAVLAANRFPRLPGTYTAHLVSLEGFNDRLDPGQLPTGTRAVRLCVLHSWTFTSDPAGTRDAAALLGDLVAPARTDRENLTLRLRPNGNVAARSTPDAEQYARRRLHLGYTPLPYRLLSGETTYGWYRGPFVPVIAAETRDFARDTPKTTADHALIYEPEHGLFDVSYAAAWTLGRALALSDPDYSEEITRARRELANTAATLMTLAADPVLAAADPGDLDGRSLGQLAAPTFAVDLLSALAGPLVPADQAPAAGRGRRTRFTQRAARAALTAEPRRAALQATAERHTRALPAWLDELTLLRRVPFNYLVPHPAMLPPESIRLFRIDENWIEALLAGARDIGVHTSLDRLVDTALTAAVESRRTRTRTGQAHRAGLLIRSELVEAWPVFDILATAAGATVTELRRDHPAPDTLLLLLDALPDEIVIREPGQGIHFGIDSTSTTGDNSAINLRDHRPGDNLGYPLRRDYPAGGGLLTRHLRPRAGDDAPDVLALRGDRGLVPALAAALDPALGDLAPGEFALQLVNAPVEQRLTLDATPGQESAR